MSRNREPVKPVESQSESGEDDDDAISEEEESDSEPEQTPTLKNSTKTQQNSEDEETGSESGSDEPPAKPVAEPQKTGNGAKSSISKPNAEPSEDDDAISEEEESDSEPEQTPTLKNSTKTQQTPTPTPKPPLSSSETGSESGSDEPQSKPPAKPVAEPQKTANGAKSSRSKPNASPTKSANAKRPAEDVSTPNVAKKAKAKEQPTAARFQRVFTDDDEIVILQGMIDFKSERKCDPTSDLNVFHDYIKNGLHADFDSSQVQSKIRRLKSKYVKKEEGTAFANPHEKTLYDLSKTIWEKGIEKSSRKASKKKVNGEVVKKNVVFIGEPSKLNSEENMLRMGREVYEADQGRDGEDEWNKLKFEEMKLYMKQLELRTAQVKLVLDVFKHQD